MFGTVLILADVLAAFRFYCFLILADEVTRLVGQVFGVTEGVALERLYYRLYISSVCVP